MNRYQITDAPVSLHTGLLQLTDEQAKPRSHQLEHIENDIYMIKPPAAMPVMFKVGELIGYDGDIPKALLMNMVETEAQQPTIDETGEQDYSGDLDDKSNNDESKQLHDDDIQNQSDDSGNGADYQPGDDAQDQSDDSVNSGSNRTRRARAANA